MDDNKQYFLLDADSAMLQSSGIMYFQMRCPHCYKEMEFHLVIGGDDHLKQRCSCGCEIVLVPELYWWHKENNP